MLLLVDFCVSAALDAVKECVTVPWRPSASSSSSSPACTEAKPDGDKLKAASTYHIIGEHQGSFGVFQDKATTKEGKLAEEPAGLDWHRSRWAALWSCV